MNDYEQLDGSLADAINSIGGIDGVDPDIDELIAEAVDLLEQARRLAEARA